MNKDDALGFIYDVESVLGIKCWHREVLFVSVFQNSLHCEENNLIENLVIISLLEYIFASF